MKTQISLSDFREKYGTHFEIRTNNKTLEDDDFGIFEENKPFFIAETPGQGFPVPMNNEFSHNQLDYAKLKCHQLNIKYIENKLRYMNNWLKNIGFITRNLFSEINRIHKAIKDVIRTLEYLLSESNSDSLYTIEYLPQELTLFKLPEEAKECRVIDYKENKSFNVPINLSFFFNFGQTPKHYYEDSLEKQCYATKRIISKPNEIVFDYDIKIEDRNGKLCAIDFSCYENSFVEINAGKLPIRMADKDFYWNQEQCKKDMQAKLDMLKNIIK